MIANKIKELQKLYSWNQFYQDRKMKTEMKKCNNPITKSFFIKSNRCSPLTSGLAIEIFDGELIIDSNYTANV